MRTRTILLTFVTLFAVVAVCFAATNVFLGTWKINEAKSMISPGGAKNSTVVYAAAGDDVKVTVDGVDASGKPTHSEWTGKFDGKEYPVTGGPAASTRSYTMVNDHTLNLVDKVGGKTTESGTLVVSPDGKTRTVTISETDASGKQITSTMVYEKQ
jgi:hypothetical protein